MKCKDCRCEMHTSLVGHTTVHHCADESTAPARLVEQVEAITLVLADREANSPQGHLFATAPSKSDDEAVASIVTQEEAFYGGLPF